MKFEQVYDLLIKHQAATDGWYVVSAQTTLRQIYQHIVDVGAKDCLELGTAFGATSCIMAAAVEENGGGTVTTIDNVLREPVGVNELARATGLSRFIHAIHMEAGYNWFLLDVLRKQTKDGFCEPCYDFCFLDGAHLWDVDALAVHLVARLLRPGSWLLMDDLHWRPREHPGWEVGFSYMSPDQVNTRHVGMVFDLLIKTHPELGQFTLANEGHLGWTRKRGGPPAIWQPSGVIAGPMTGVWSQRYDGFVATRDTAHTDGVSIEPQGLGARIVSTAADPNVQLNTPVVPPQPIDYVTLRVRLLAPDMDFVQLYWIGIDDQYFDEARSTRCIVRSLSALQDLTFPLVGTERERTIRALRFDPGTGPCDLLLENVTLGRR